MYQSLINSFNFKVKGIFYVLAGEQARLIDDITGTTPPYDKSIVLGPQDANKFCDQASKELGIGVAIVDVNDLGRVKILASSPLCDKTLIKKALVKIKNREIVFKQIDLINKKISSRNQLVFMPSH